MEADRACDEGEHASPPEGCPGETHLPDSNSSLPPIATPPYWTSHGRTVSNASFRSSGSAPILLEDHSGEGHDLAKGCWARSATIDDPVLISGPTGIGAYIVWHCTVQTLKGGDLVIRKRRVGYCWLIAIRADMRADTLNSINYVQTSSKPSLTQRP